MYGYNVRFVGDLFYLSTTVEVASGDSDAAIEAAIALLRDHYGWDMDEVANVDIGAELAYKEVTA